MRDRPADCLDDFARGGAPFFLREKRADFTIAPPQRRTFPLIFPQKNGGVSNAQVNQTAANIHARLVFCFSFGSKEKRLPPSLRHFSAISLTTCPAMISPITEGTKAVLPGVARRDSPSG